MAFRASRAERDRIRHLLAIDAASVMRRLADRREEMVTIFSRQRDRGALLMPLRSTLTTARFSDLAVLTIEEQRAAFLFHEALDDLHWYLQYTVDMPGTLEMKFQHYLRVLAEAFEKFVRKFGAVSEQQEEADMPAPPMPKRLPKRKLPRRPRPKRRTI
jgi:hypothetical protein